jgi:hypothetical protein
MEIVRHSSVRSKATRLQSYQDMKTKKQRTSKILFEFHFIKFSYYSHTVYNIYHKNFRTLSLHFMPIPGSQTYSTKFNYGHNETIIFFPLMLTSLLVPKMYQNNNIIGLQSVASQCEECGT